MAEKNEFNLVDLGSPKPVDIKKENNYISVLRSRWQEKDGEKRIFDNVKLEGGFINQRGNLIKRGAIKLPKGLSKEDWRRIVTAYDDFSSPEAK